MNKKLTERTLVLIKPDGVQRGIVGEILSRFERSGIKPVAMKMVYPNEKLAGDHYMADEAWMEEIGRKQRASYEKKGLKIEKTNLELGQDIRKFLLDYMTMSPVVAMVLEGHNVVAHVRKLVGPTNPSDAQPGTIRGDYTFDTYTLADPSKRPIQNLIHASGEVQEAEREIAIWFKPEEIHDWERLDEALLYRKGE